MSGPRETAYDDKIAPLVERIIGACKAAGIPMFATFELDGDMACTTALPLGGDEGKVPALTRVVYDGWAVQRPFTMSMCVSGPGSVETTEAPK